MFSDIIILAISFGFVAVGILRWQKASDLQKIGKKAKAVVFKNNRKTGGGFGLGTSGSLCYPVVRFLTEKQEWITQELNTGYSPAKEEGTKLEVIYDPDDPTNVEINSTFQLEILPRLLVFLGLFGLLFGILELFAITQLID